MAILNFKYVNAAASGVETFATSFEGASYEIKSASFTQNGATVPTDSTDFRTLTLQDGSGNTIGTITTNSGDADGTALTQNVRVPFIMSGRQNAILAANEQVKVAGTKGGSGKVADGIVSLEIVAARAY